MSALSQLKSATVCGAVGTAYDVVLRAFPPVVRIETTNACNGRCVICPHRTMQRPIRRMDEAHFRDLVDQCAAGGCREVHLHNFGEPLLDPALPQRIRYAKSKGVEKVKIFSNGSLLDRDWAERLLDAGLDEVKISIDGADREEFEQIRPPLRYDAVIANVRGLVALRNRRGAGLQVHVACCTTTDRQMTRQMLEGVVDGFAFSRFHNWADIEVLGGQPGVRKPCSRLWRTMTILAGGEVALCCLDYEGRHVLGRTDQGESLVDIWRGAAYRAVRRLHQRARQADLSLCAGCSKAFW